MTIDITEVVVALIGLLSTIITVFIVPYLQQKLGNEKYNRLIETARIATKAAEQLYKVKYPDGGAGELKLEFALSYMREKGYDINSNDVLNAIEAAVNEINVAGDK